MLISATSALGYSNLYYFNGVSEDNSRPKTRATRDTERGKSGWQTGENAFFDVCITNANCLSQYSLKIQKVLEYTEMKRMLRKCKECKCKECYKKVMNVARDKLSFSILRLTLLCRRQSPEKFWKDDWRVFLVFDDAEIQKN